MLGQELIRYKEREKRWIKREKKDRADLEAWKTSAGVSLLELTDCENFVKTFRIYEKVREIGYLESWEKAFSFYDKKILEDLLLEDINEFFALDQEFHSFEEVTKKITAEETFVIFIEREMDSRPGVLPGNLILDMLDKLSLLKYTQESEAMV